MITPIWVQTMARYNTWQNSQLIGVLDCMDQAELDLPRGAFFGSLQGTLSHLLWGDTLWMSRFDAGCPAPAMPPGDTSAVYAIKDVWLDARRDWDDRIIRWSERITQDDLEGDLTWVYSFEEKVVTKPLGFCITHFFNHQTHHRGQVHAMLTATGRDAPVSDLSYLPEAI